MQESLDVSTIIFALLAAFILWKLRSVLGERNGAERPPRRGGYFDESENRRQRPGDDSNVVRLPGAPEPAAGARPIEAQDPAERWKGFAEPGSKTSAGLTAIAAVDPSFEIAAFLDGAKTAYEMIITAFAAGDRATLSALLAKDVLASFETAISEREKRGEKVETTFVSVDRPKIEDAELVGRAAQITLRFASGMITVTRDKADAVIEGSPDRVCEVTDIWTFAREAGARDPNWKLVATGAGA